MVPAGAPQAEQKRPFVETSVPQDEQEDIKFSRYSLTLQNENVCWVPSLRVTLGARFEKFLRFEVTQDFQPSSLPAHAALSAADAMDWRYVFVRGEFMKIRVVSALLMILAFVCCSSTPRTVATTPASRVYQGTASVGDFMTITVNSGEGTIAYTDVSNNTSGTVPYTTNSDGTY